METSTREEQEFAAAIFDEIKVVRERGGLVVAHAVSDPEPLADGLHKLPGHLDTGVGGPRISTILLLLASSHSRKRKEDEAGQANETARGAVKTPNCDALAAAAGTAKEPSCCGIQGERREATRQRVEPNRHHT